MKIKTLFICLLLFICSMHLVFISGCSAQEKKVEFPLKGAGEEKKVSFTLKGAGE